MQRYVPPRWTVAPVSAEAAWSASARSGHTGSAIDTCATIPSSKNEGMRRFVWS